MDHAHLGIMRILEFYDVDISGMNAVIVGKAYFRKADGNDAS